MLSWIKEIKKVFTRPKKPAHTRNILATGGILLLFVFIGVFSWLISPKPDTFNQSLFNANAATVQIPDAGIQARIEAKKDSATISFTRENSSLAFSVPLNEPSLVFDESRATFTSANKLVELEYELLKNGIKEDIILHADPHTNTFVSHLKTQNLKPYIAPEQQIVFFDQNSEYQFHFESPYAIDAAGNKTYAVQYELKESARKDEQYVAPDNTIIQGDQVTKSLLSSVDLDAYLSTAEVDDYELTVVVDPGWLNSPERVYPIRIDPTVVHDQSSHFAGGRFNRTIDSGSGSNPFIEVNYQPNQYDQFTSAYWKMNETFGSTLLDASGNGNTGTATGTLAVTGKPGFGSAREFNGTNNYISVPSSASLLGAATSDLTLEAWVKTSATGNLQVVLNHGTTSSWLYMLGIREAGELNCRLYQQSSGSSYIDLVGGRINDNEWNHIACVANGTTLSIYINGELVGTSNSTAGTRATSTSGDLSIGRFNWSTNYWYSGAIDDVKISSVARSSDQIQASAQRRPYGKYTSNVVDLGTDILMSLDTLSWDDFGQATGDGETLADTTGLIAQWNFNETSGTTAANNAGSCGASCNGTLTNFANTSGQDVVANSGWTADNSRWGAGALMFDGTNDYVEVSNHASLQLTNDFTIETWIKRNAKTATTERIISKSDSTLFDYWLQIFQDNIHCGVRASANYTVVSTTRIDTENWYHVVCTLDSSNVWQVYINGKNVTGATSGTPAVANTTTRPLNFGRIGNGSSFDYNFNGSIDSTRIYSRTLSPSEILANYNSSKIQFETRTSPDGSTWEEWRPTGNTTAISPSSWSRTDSEKILTTSSLPKLSGASSQVISTHEPSSMTGYYGYWKLDETSGTGSYLKDSSGNNRDATPTGTSFREGVIGGARNGNGTNESIEFPATNFTQGTLEFWLNISPSQTWASRFDLISGEISSGNGRFLVYRFDATTLRYYITFNNTVYTADIPNAHINLVDTWNHVALTFADSNNGGAMQIYINGNLINSTNVSHTYNATNTKLFFFSDRNVTSFTNAKIDNVALHTTVLSETDIQKRYALSAGNFVSANLATTDMSTEDFLIFDIAADRPGTYLQSTILDNSENYVVESFTSTGAQTWTVPDNVTNVDVLVIGGGGGSGNNGGAGGGAGGYQYLENVSVQPNSEIPIEVGAGGAAASIPNGTRFNGGDGGFSSFYTIQTRGGGGGAAGGVGPSSRHGRPGGSGGGASAYGSGSSGTGGAAIGPGVGFKGGNTSTNANAFVAGGGGGAGGAAPNVSSSSNLGGVGGAGLTNSITGTPVTRASGGSGYLQATATPGGGGASGQDGAPNTGGGAGGPTRSGGSGVVIVRYKVGSATTPVTIDFGAKLDNMDLITNSADYSFTVDATKYGLVNKGSNIFPGETIIVRQNIDGTVYLAQGEVATVNHSAGAITVTGWDGASTFPSGGFTNNADVFKWQRVYWDISKYESSLRNSIDTVRFSITNGHAGRNIWIDNLQSSTAALTNPAGSTPTSTPNRYFQYRAIFSNWDTAVSAGLESVTLDYTINEPPNIPSLNSPADSATGVGLTPTLQTTATDPNSDYLRYRITLCEDSGMTSNCQTFNQVSSQAGWSGQNTQTSTAYTSGTQASYTIQTPLQQTTTYYWKSEAIDPAGTNTWGDTQVTPYSFTTFTNTPPGLPTSLEASGATNPTDLASAPNFTAIYNDPDVTDVATNFGIQVSTQSNFSMIYSQWNGALSPNTAQGARSVAIAYSGPQLPLDGETYYWRIRFTDNYGAVGAWSTETATFSMYDLKDSPTCVIQKANDNSSMTVIWNNIGTGADAFEVERRVNAGAWTNIATEPGSANSYQDTNITNGNSYQYRVRSSYLSAKGEWCVMATLTPDMGNLRFSAF